MLNASQTVPEASLASLLHRIAAGNGRFKGLLLGYELVVIGIGALILGQNLPAVLPATHWDLIMLAAVSVLLPSIMRPSSLEGRYRSPIAFAMSVTAFVMFGAAGGAWLAAIAGGAAMLTAEVRRPSRLAFGIAAYVISAFLGGRALELAGGWLGNTVSWGVSETIGILVAVVLLAILRTLALLVSLMLTERDASPAEGLTRLPSYVAMGGFGLGLALLYQTVGPAALLVLLIPSAIAGQTSRRYARQVQEAQAKNGVLEQQISDLHTINRISSHFASMHTIEQALQLAAAGATGLGGFQFALVLKCDEMESCFSLGATSGLEPQYFSRASDLLGAFAPAAAIREGPVVITREAYPLHIQALRSLDIQAESLVALPIKHVNQCMGVLFVGSVEAPGTRQISFLKTLAAQTAQAVANASLFVHVKQLAITDHLTGLYNHRFFQEDLEAQLTRHNMTGDTLVLMMIDLDHFKEFNDRFGHLAGNVLLQQVCSRMRSALRSSDVTCRYGGDEFVVVVPHSDTTRAIAIAERIRQAVADTTVALCDVNGEIKDARVTVSIGIALSGPNRISRQDLTNAADKALQQAKREGRNRLCLLE